MKHKRFLSFKGFKKSRRPGTEWGAMEFARGIPLESHTPGQSLGGSYQ